MHTYIVKWVLAGMPWLITSSIVIGLAMAFSIASSYCIDSLNVIRERVLNDHGYVAIMLTNIKPLNEYGPSDSLGPEIIDRLRAIHGVTEVYPIYASKIYVDEMQLTVYGYPRALFNTGFTEWFFRLEMGEWPGYGEIVLPISMLRHYMIGSRIPIRIGDRIVYLRVSGFAKTMIVGARSALVDAETLASMYSVPVNLMRAIGAVLAINDVDPGLAKSVSREAVDIIKGVLGEVDVLRYYKPLKLSRWRTNIANAMSVYRAALTASEASLLTIPPLTALLMMRRRRYDIIILVAHGWGLDGFLKLALTYTLMTVAIGMPLSIILSPVAELALSYQFMGRICLGLYMEPYTILLASLAMIVAVIMLYAGGVVYGGC